jgi:uncharacterized protein (TIGR03067 family)
MPAPVTLSAEEYNQEITDIDRLVFAEGPFDASRRESLAGRLEELARRMKASSDSRFIAIEVLEVRRLAEVAKRAPAKPRPQMLSDPWMRIRSNVFDDRSWFARSAADLEAVAASEPSPLPVAAGRHADVAVGASRSHALEGRWRVQELYGDGKPTHDPELSGAIWIFAGDDLSMTNPAGGTELWTFTRIDDARGSALYLRAKGPVAGGSETGWLIYHLAGDTLTVAFHDGLGERPESFEAQPGKKPLLIQARLARENESGLGLPR